MASSSPKAPVKSVLVLSVCVSGVLVVFLAGLALFDIAQHAASVMLAACCVQVLLTISYFAAALAKRLSRSEDES